MDIDKYIWTTVNFAVVHVYLSMSNVKFAICCFSVWTLLALIGHFCFHGIRLDLAYNGSSGVNFIKKGLMATGFGETREFRTRHAMGLKSGKMYTRLQQCS